MSNRRHESVGARLKRLYWQDDRRRIDALKIPNGGTLPPDLFQILSVRNEFYSVRATFRRKDGIWSFLHGDPELQWMRGIPFTQIKIDLLKRGCSWEWLHELEPDGATVGPTSTAMAGKQL